MKLLETVKSVPSKVRSTFLIIGGLALLLVGVSKVPHFGDQNSIQSSSGLDIGGVAHAEAGDSAGGDSAGSGGGDGSGGDSGGSSSSGG